jgi:hypothetical protein
MPATIFEDAVAFLHERRVECPDDQPPVAIDALIGPRHDCCKPELAPTADKSEIFHLTKIEALAATAMISCSHKHYHSAFRRRGNRKRAHSSMGCARSG